MQYKKLTRDQKRVYSWRCKRAKLLKKTLDENPHMLHSEALRIANKLAGRCPKKK